MMDQMSSTARRTLEICNEKGLHARASAKLVETVEKFDADAEISRDGMSAGGDSIMGLLMLAASKGTSIEVETRGAEAEALAELADWVRQNTQERFGPVRQVAPDLVFELSFDAVRPSPRRKSGLELPGARATSWHRNRPAQKANRLADLAAMLP